MLGVFLKNAILSGLQSLVRGRFWMNVSVYRGWFIVGSLIFMLLAAAPTLALFIRIPSGSERFSELWLLGPGHKAEGYPFNVRVNETYSVYVGVGDHLGYPAYYKIFVKFRNQTQPVPVDSNSTPSSLPGLYEFDFSVGDGDIWEMLLSFEIRRIESSGAFMTVDSLSINDVTFRVNSTSVWNAARSGFYYQLFFELWLYNMTSQRFQFHNRFVGIWLNFTV